MAKLSHRDDRSQLASTSQDAASDVYAAGEAPRAGFDLGGFLDLGARARTPIQRFATGASAPPAFTRKPATGGAALPAVLQAKMNDAFGADFSAVRVHHDGQAEQAGARAYAAGTDLHFAAGEYDPDSERGQALIGHELAHVTQQRAGRVAGEGIVDHAGFEREADEQGARAARGEQIAGSQPAVAQGALQRNAVQRAEVTATAAPSAAAPTSAAAPAPAQPGGVAFAAGTTIALGDIPLTTPYGTFTLSPSFEGEQKAPPVDGKAPAPPPSHGAAVAGKGSPEGGELSASASGYLRDLFVPGLTMVADKASFTRAPDGLSFKLGVESQPAHLGPVTFSFSFGAGVKTTDGKVEVKAPAPSVSIKVPVLPGTTIAGTTQLSGSLLIVIKYQPNWTEIYRVVARAVNVAENMVVGTGGSAATPVATGAAEAGAGAVEAGAGAAEAGAGAAKVGLWEACSPTAARR